MNNPFEDIALPLDSLKRDLRAHYARQWRLMDARPPVWDALDAYDRAHPGLDSYQLKAAQYRMLAETMDTVILDDSPFYFVNNMCRGPQAGIPYYSDGGWLFMRNKHLCRDVDPAAYARYEGMIKCLLFAGNEAMYFDDMHYCYPVSNVVKNGLKYYYEQAEALLATCETAQERSYLQSAMEGLLAARRVAQRFSQLALERLKSATAPQAVKFLRMIADTAARVPWEGCRHFYEGLNTMWFCRDVLGVMDGIGNSHLGRPDYTLREMYERDIATGYITREEAVDLVSRFLVHGDCQYDKDAPAQYLSDHELEMGFVLGGCDPDGAPVFNDITTLFIRAHRAQNLIYPKIHYRVGENACETYLRDIAHDFLRGRSVGGVVNDETIIPFLMNAGVSPQDARSYVNYGCWGFTVESKYNSAGGSFVHMLSVMERTVYGDNDDCRAVGLHFDTMDDARSFEDVYGIFYGNLLRALNARAQLLVGKHGDMAARVNPIPIYSVCMSGWAAQKRDFPRGINLTFNLAETANVVDALLAIKHLCFEKKALSLPEFLRAVRANWAGYEDVRRQVCACPHFGDESEESQSLAARLIEGVRRDVGAPFGRPCGISLLIYQEFRFDGEKMRATPDGRRDGDVVALGINPTRLHADPVPAVLGNAAIFNPLHISTHSLTLQVPFARMTEDTLVAMLRASLKLPMKHLQINCVDPQTLLDAQRHPENHQDIIVRVCGFSAKFVSLSPAWQEEFIQRAVNSI